MGALRVGKERKAGDEWVSNLWLMGIWQVGIEGFAGVGCMLG